ncbi:MAG: hypothetical protein V4549_06500 [Bacteroidota bacterium]
MGKELPYFKFNVAQWLTGDIVFEEFDVQGLFINICAIYWQRNGKLSIEDINKRYKNPPQLKQLTDRFFSVTDGLISVKFLNELFEDKKLMSIVNSKNGALGGRPKQAKILNKKPTANRPLTEPKANQSNIEKRREEKNIGRKVLFSQCLLFDKDKFKEAFPDWPKSKLKHYYEAADDWSVEGNKKVDWTRTIKKWAKKDDDEGKLKFAADEGKTTESLEERAARLTANNHP